ncbi:MAG: sigma factor [Myxococcota bacterium]
MVDRALDGDPEACRCLVSELSPVIQTRVARALLRRRAQARGRNLRQELEDLVQEVFAALFASGGKALKAWDPERGLSFTSFVGFLAEREVAMAMRSGRRNPWTEEPMSPGVLGAVRGAADSHEARVAARQLMSRVADRLRERLTPLGRHYLQVLVFEQRSVSDVAASTGATPASLYAWKSRLGKLIREVRSELLPDGEVHE